MEGAWNIGKVLIGLGFVIFVHELGHFLVAKACGVQCDKFYVGFDVPIRIGPLRLPGAIFKVQWGETEYGIGTIPLGGYVKMLGQDDNPNQAEEEASRIRTVNEDGEEVLNPRSYPAKNVPQRMAIISAGVSMNRIFGILMAAVAYKIGTPIQPAAVGGITYGSPAWKAGWKSGYDLVGFSDDDEDSPGGLVVKKKTPGRRKGLILDDDDDEEANDGNELEKDQVGFVNFLANWC